MPRPTTVSHRADVSNRKGFQVYKDRTAHPHRVFFRPPRVQTAAYSDRRASHLPRFQSTAFPMWARSCTV
jgi:hypothetical protein